MNQPRTKIVATIGPASESPPVIDRLVEAGVDAFRLNFSHGTLEQHARALHNIREVCRARGVEHAVVGDLCGSKIRVDPLEGGPFELGEGDRIDIVAEHVAGNRDRISTNRPQLINEVQAGHRVLIDDGLVRLRVAEVLPDRLHCVCESGGGISDRKGVNLPDSALAMPSLTESDHEHVNWAAEHELDYLALSFVRTPDDVEELRSLLAARGAEIPIIAKIETLQASRHLDGIIAAADMVLIARGDLGLEMNLERVPLLQKEITRKCQLVGKPAIVATQMLQSMVDSPTATRAEVSDVANAIFDAADAVMLSAETAVGRYPVQAVNLMGRIATETETYLEARGGYAQVDVMATMRPVTTAVAHGASLLCRELDAKLVAAWTKTGNTARLLSKYRIGRPVVGLSPDRRTCRRMSLYYGVIPLCREQDQDTLAMLRQLDRDVRQMGVAAPGDLAVVITGTELRQVGSTNALLIHLVEG